MGKRIATEALDEKSEPYPASQVPQEFEIYYETPHGLHNDS